MFPLRGYCRRREHERAEKLGKYLFLFYFINAFIKVSTVANVSSSFAVRASSMAAFVFSLGSSYMISVKKIVVSIMSRLFRAQMHDRMMICEVR